MVLKEKRSLLSNYFDKEEKLVWKLAKTDLQRIAKSFPAVSINKCRETNQALQLKQPLWQELLALGRIIGEIEAQDKTTISKQAEDKLDALKSKRDKKCDECKRCIEQADEAGPVGNRPIHDCILLGQINLAKEAISECNELGLCKYDNDMQPWQEVLSKAGIQIDRGLYTGETVLHMAIGLKNEDLVSFLLEKGADTSARVTGLFFMPPWIPKEGSGLFDRIAKYLGSSRSFNEYSRCYFGEFPLSFAASVGSPAMCALIYDKILDKGGTEGARAALHYPDLFGNTALHMAVIHRQKHVIDWILAREDDILRADREQAGGKAQQQAKAEAGGIEKTEGRVAGKPPVGAGKEVGHTGLLDVMNNDGLTPLTLAARLGSVAAVPARALPRPSPPFRPRRPGPSPAPSFPKAPPLRLLYGVGLPRIEPAGQPPHLANPSFPGPSRQHPPPPALTRSPRAAAGGHGRRAHVAHPLLPRLRPRARVRPGARAGPGRRGPASTRLRGRGHSPRAARAPRVGVGGEGTPRTNEPGARSVPARGGPRRPKGTRAAGRSGARRGGFAAWAGARVQCLESLPIL